MLEIDGAGIIGDDFLSNYLARTKYKIGQEGCFFLYIYLSLSLSPSLKSFVWLVARLASKTVIVILWFRSFSSIVRFNSAKDCHCGDEMSLVCLADFKWWGIRIWFCRPRMQAFSNYIWIRKVKWPGVKWPGVKWPGVKWPGVKWPGVIWPGVKWPGVKWPGGNVSIFHTRIHPCLIFSSHLKL